MRETVAGILFIVIAFAAFAPEYTGRELGGLHKSFMTGWEQGHQ